MMREKRKHARRPLVGPLDIKSKDDGSNIAKGYVVDLNERGMRIVTRNDLKMGEEFSLHFRLPNDWALDFLGKIVHKVEGVLTNSYGVEFSKGQETVVLKLL
jgi:hypothetical protein